MYRWMKPVVIAFLMWVYAPTAMSACRDDLVELRGDFGQARFNVELADTPQERGQGLMFRENLARSSGMLFVFERAGRVSFWMRNTLIPLDMIFIDERGVVTKIHANAVPLDETHIAADNTKYVLEVNGGLSAAIGLSVGNELRHPAISQPAWPCE